MLHQDYYHLREIFVCVRSDWCVFLVQTLVAIRAHGICLNELCFVSGQVVGGGTCVFLR